MKKCELFARGGSTLGGAHGATGDRGTDVGGTSSGVSGAQLAGADAESLVLCDMVARRRARQRARGVRVEGIPVSEWS